MREIRYKFLNIFIASSTFNIIPDNRFLNPKRRIFIVTFAMCNAYICSMRSISICTYMSLYMHSYVYKINVYKCSYVAQLIMFCYLMIHCGIVLLAFKYVFSIGW